MPSVAPEWQGCARGMTATAATDTFQSSYSKALPSGEANKGAVVTAWGSNPIMSPCLRKKKKKSGHSAVGEVRKAYGSLNPDFSLGFVAGSVPNAKLRVNS